MAVDGLIHGDRKKTAQKDQITLRFDLDIDSPSDESFSEFSYLQLVRDQKKQQKLGSTSVLSEHNVSSSSNLFPDDSNEHLAAIAKKLEEKYGSKPSKKRKRMIYDTDYIDRGYGYDLTDSFVDDTEFYEDFVPDHVDTKYGGFYINAGELEFKAAEDIDEVDFVMKKKPKIKKQPSHQTPQAILASQKLKKAKQHAALQKAPSGVKKSLFSVPSSSQPHFKQPPLKKPRKKINPNRPSGTTSLPVLPGVSISIGDKSVTVPIFSSADTALSSTSVTTTVEAGVVMKTGEQAVNKSPPELPSNLPGPIVDVVTKLKEKVATDQKQEGKVTIKQRERYNEILLEVESACKSIPMKTRNAVFEYLAHSLGVARGTLTKRMKQLAKRKEDGALESPLLKLKHAIEMSMPKQIALYEEELKKSRTESTSSSLEKTGELDEDTKPDDVFDECSLMSEHLSSSQLPCSLILGGQSATGPGEGSTTTTKPKRLPRKKYRWAENEEVKALLFEVVRVKVQSEESCSRFSREKGEEVINQFLEDKIRPLWPKGWMPKSVLYKITEPIHKSYTSPLPRRVIKKEKQSGGKGMGAGSNSPQLPKKLPTPLTSSSVSVASTSNAMDTVSPRLMGVVHTLLTEANDSNSTFSTVSSVPRTVLMSSNKQASLKALTSQTVPVKIIGQPPSTVAVMPSEQATSLPITTWSMACKPKDTQPDAVKPVKRPILSIIKTPSIMKQTLKVTEEQQAVPNPPKPVVKLESDHGKKAAKGIPQTNSNQTQIPLSRSPHSVLTTSAINNLLLSALAQQPRNTVSVTLSSSSQGVTSNFVSSVVASNISPPLTSKSKAYAIGTNMNSQYNSPVGSCYVSSVLPGVVQQTISHPVSKPTGSLLSEAQLNSLKNKLHIVPSPLASSPPVSAQPTGSKTPKQSPSKVFSPVSLKGSPTVKHLTTSQSYGDHRYDTKPAGYKSPMEQIFVEHSYLGTRKVQTAPGIRIEQQESMKKAEGKKE